LIAPRLSDRSEEVKHIAIGQLKKLAHDIDITSHLAAICQIVRDADRFSATIACEVIGQLGSRAHAAVPSLLDALNSKDAYIVIAAAEALWRVERRVDVALPHLAMLFPEHGETVCDVITQIGPAAAPLIGQVIAALESDEWDLQWAAAAAAELLRAQLHSSRPGLAAWSAIALAKITGDEMTVPMLVKLLEQVDRDELRYQAAVALEAIGPRALAAVPALNTLRDDPDDQIRTAVEAALSAVSAARH
jgi:HEAT repeat protein